MLVCTLIMHVMQLLEHVQLEPLFINVPFVHEKNGAVVDVVVAVVVVVVVEVTVVDVAVVDVVDCVTVTLTEPQLVVLLLDEHTEIIDEPALMPPIVKIEPFKLAETKPELAFDEI